MLIPVKYWGQLLWRSPHKSPRKEPTVRPREASTFLYRSSGKGRYRGAGNLPLETWTLEEHLSFVDRWMPAAPDFGGACGLLPLVLHWASLPYRPVTWHWVLLGGWGGEV
eukprot:s1517_g28.t1